MSENLEKLLVETRDKSPEAATLLTCLIKKLLLIVSRTGQAPRVSGVRPKGVLPGTLYNSNVKYGRYLIFTLEPVVCKSASC